MMNGLVFSQTRLENNNKKEGHGVRPSSGKQLRETHHRSR